MARYSIEGSTLQGIANAIREQNGESDTYTPEEMIPAILSLKTGGGIAELPDDLVYYTDGSTSVTLPETISIVDLIYPIGSIYMSVSDVDPSILFGGTWDRIQDTFLLAAGSSYVAGTTGGSATHQHELSDAGWAQINAFTTADKIGMNVKQLEETYPCNRAATVTEGGTDVDYSTRQGVTLDGMTDMATALPPYLAVYMWKRTA